MNFKECVDYIRNNKKIDASHFDKVTDITNTIDFLNEQVSKEKQKWADNEIHEISKFLANSLYRKYFFFGGKK